jgi:hypothetical protein
MSARLGALLSLMASKEEVHSFKCKVRLSDYKVFSDYGRTEVYPEIC